MANTTMRVSLVRDSLSIHTFGLQSQLAAQSAVVRVTKRYRDLPAQLSAVDPPDLILTDLYLPDGSWEDVLQMAQKAPVPLNVIVVSRLVDIQLYVEALEKGAFDFITPPFEAAELSHVLRTAYWNVIQKREAQSRTRSFPTLHVCTPTLPWSANSSQVTPSSRARQSLPKTH